MQVPVLELMQMSHDSYNLVNSKKVIPIKQIPNFLDLCSKVIDSFVSHIIVIDSDEYHNDMFSVVNRLIDNFEILFENDNPMEFFAAKHEVENNTLPAFKSLMTHFSLCVQKPQPLKKFYLNLITKVEEIFNEYIVGDE
tara:strand:+ start:801 stop:1217 length:417 start_codon:yes stop_codon:yes gene_type:complete